MTDRQFLWGLSNGVMLLALAGAFWLGLGIGMLADRLRWEPLAAFTICQVGGFASLLWGGIRLRRRAGFRRSEMRAASGVARLETQRIMTVLRRTALLQTALTAGAVWWCVHAGAEHLIWPTIGLIVSLHFFPLARVFHVRAYHVTAAAGSVVCLATFAMGRRSAALPVLAVGMALVMWGTAAYALANADGMATRALRETWAPRQRAEPAPTSGRR